MVAGRLRSPRADGCPSTPVHGEGRSIVESERKGKKPAKATTSAKPEGRFMTQREVAEKLGIDRSTIIRWCKSGTNEFPKPVKVVARTYLFCRLEIETWELDRAWAEQQKAKRG
jgi:predicted DNA-binding transcriptional regulator AlpA